MWEDVMENRYEARVEWWSGKHAVLRVEKGKDGWTWKLLDYDTWIVEQRREGQALDKAKLGALDRWMMYSGAPKDDRIVWQRA
jgi:hypothetical protein